MTASIRTAAGSQANLYDSSFNPELFEDDILSSVQKLLEGGTFNFVAALIREIELPPAVHEAINDKFKAEQSVLEQRYNVQRAYENFKQQYIDAEGLRVAAQIVNSGLTENFLRYQGIEATRKLAESNNAKLVIIGDKDGLPLILNPESLSVNQANSQPDTSVQTLESEAQPSLEIEALSGYLGQLSERVEGIGLMPEFKATTLPQVSGTNIIKGE
jgi:regulator of protease activity HflC (stomatin/prohibitin superfamily)